MGKPISPIEKNRENFGQGKTPNKWLFFKGGRNEDFNWRAN